MQINERENMNVLYLQAFDLAPKMGRLRSSSRSFDRGRQVGKYLELNK